MAGEIGVKLTAQDEQFIATTKQASSAMAALAAQEEKLAKVAKAAGLDQKKFSATFRAIEKQNAVQSAKEQSAASKAILSQKKDAEKTVKAEAADAKRLGQQADKTRKANEKATKDLAKKTEKDTKAHQLAEKKAAAQAKKDQTTKQKADKQSAEAFEKHITLLKAGAAAAAGVGVAVLGIATAGAVALGSLAKIALAFGGVKAETKGALDILTGGRADKALALIDKEAVRLGLQIQQTRDDFIKFRQAGLDNKQSAALLKLKADLIATKHPAEQVQEAVDRVLSYASNGPQTKDQALAAGRAMKLLAKQAHIAGDGTAAAALAATTLEGALNRIDNAKTQALERLGEKIKPSADKAATAVANLVEKFLSSKRGQETIDKTADAIIALADVVTKYAPKLEQFSERFSKGLDGPAVKLRVLSGGLELIGKGLTGIGERAQLAISPLNLLSFAAGKAGAALGEALVEPALKAAGRMYDAGKNIVSGLAKGIADAAGTAIDSVVNLANRISKAFRGELEIKSPSKRFERDGVNIGKGVDRGADKSMPTGKELAKRLEMPKGSDAAGVALKVAPVLQMRDRPASPTVSAPAGGDTYITIQVQGGKTNEETWDYLRHKLDLYYQAKRLQEGRAA